MYFIIYYLKQWHKITIVQSKTDSEQSFDVAVFRKLLENINNDYFSSESYNNPTKSLFVFINKNNIMNAF